MYLKKHADIPPERQLPELFRYESNIEKCNYVNDSVHALLLQRIGAQFLAQGQFVIAVEYTNKAIRLIEKHRADDAQYERHNIQNYYNLSIIFDSLANPAGKMKANDSCIALTLRYKTRDLFAITPLFKKTKYLFDSGDYFGCIEYATKCESNARKYSANETNPYRDYALEVALSCLHWEINARIVLGDYAAAERLLTNKVDEYKKAGLQRYLGILFGQMAEVQINKGNYVQALDFYQRAIFYNHQSGDDIGCKVLLNNIGFEIYHRNNYDFSLAFDYYKKSILHVNRDLSRTAEDSIEALNTLGNIANLYIKRGQFDSGMIYFQKAFDQFKPNTNELTLLQLTPPEFAKTTKINYLTSLLMDKGDAYKDRYFFTHDLSYIVEALRIYKVAELFIQRMKAEQAESESKLFWRKESMRLYESAIEANYIYGKPEFAFYFFERSRAVLLQDQLSEQQWMGQEDILNQTQARKSIQKLENELFNCDKASSRYLELTERLFVQKRSLEQLEKSIKSKNPLYHQNFIDSGRIALPEVKDHVLQKHQALVELFVGDSAVYALVITANHSKISKINRDDFINAVDAYLKYISNSSLSNQDFSGFIKSSHHLYQLIFGDNPVPPGRIIISPDGNYFPFESLVLNEDPGDPQYFLNDHSVCYTYSARYFMNNFESPNAKSAKYFMGMAPEQFPASMQLLALSGSGLSLAKLSRNFDNSENYTGTQASKRNFMNQFFRYRIIQLYTHATDSGRNGEPVIYFSDSALYLSDLINENKPITRLIVLSACETGNGKLYKGEGVFSFNRGFAALGIPASITNLWRIDNESTYTLTEYFYNFLSEGLPTDIALQKAKLKYIKEAGGEKSLPAFWAAAILIGKTDEIMVDRQTHWNKIGLIALCFLLAGGTIFYFRRRKSPIPTPGTRGIAA